MTLTKFILGNLMKCKKKVLKKSNSLFAPILVNHYILPDVNFNGHCLINNKTVLHYNCLYETVKLTKNADPDK